MNFIVNNVRRSWLVLLPSYLLLILGCLPTVRGDYVSSGITFAEAEQACEDGYHLGSCANEAECNVLQHRCNDFLFEFWSEGLDDGVEFACWIGLEGTVPGHSGNFSYYRWVDGTSYNTLVFNPWAEHQPVEIGIDLSCGYLNQNGQGKVSNELCVKKLAAFVCQEMSTPAPVVPTTSSPPVTVPQPTLPPSALTSPPTAEPSPVPSPAPSTAPSPAPSATPTRTPSEPPTSAPPITSVHPGSVSTSTVNWSPEPTPPNPDDHQEQSFFAPVDEISTITAVLLSMLCILSVCLCVSFWLGWKAHKHQQIKALRQWNSYVDSRTSVSSRNTVTHGGESKVLSEFSRFSAHSSVLHSTVLSTQRSESNTANATPTANVTPGTTTLPAPAAPPPLAPGASMSVVTLKSRRSSRRESTSSLSLSAPMASDDDDGSTDVRWLGSNPPSSRDQSPSNTPLPRRVGRSVSVHLQKSQSPPSPPQTQRISGSHSLGRFQALKNSVLSRSRSKKFERKKLPFQLKNVQSPANNSTRSRTGSDSDAEGSVRIRSGSEESLSISFSGTPSNLVGGIARQSDPPPPTTSGKQLVALPPTTRRRLEKRASVDGSHAGSQVEEEASYSPSLSVMSSLFGPSHRRLPSLALNVAPPAAANEDSDDDRIREEEFSEHAESDDNVEVSDDGRGDDEVGAAPMVPSSPSSVRSSPSFFGVEAGTPLPQFSLNSRDDGKKHREFDTGSSISPFTKSLVNRLGNLSRSPSPRIETPIACSPQTFQTAATSAADGESLLPTSYSDPFNSSLRGMRLGEKGDRRRSRKGRRNRDDATLFDT